MDVGTPRAVLFDVDGTLLDVLPNLRQVWTEWALRHDLDPELRHDLDRSLSGAPRLSLVRQRPSPQSRHRWIQSRAWQFFTSSRMRTHTAVAIGV